MHPVTDARFCCQLARRIELATWALLGGVEYGGRQRGNTPALRDLVRHSSSTFSVLPLDIQNLTATLCEQRFWDDAEVASPVTCNVRSVLKDETISWRAASSTRTLQPADVLISHNTRCKQPQIGSTIHQPSSRTTFFQHWLSSTERGTC
jgi:hypothetical protein